MMKTSNKYIRDSLLIENRNLKEHATSSLLLIKRTSIHVC